MQPVKSIQASKARGFAASPALVSVKAGIVSMVLLIASLVVRGVKGAMLIGIGLSACVSWATGLHPLPESVVEVPSAHLF